MTDDLQVGVEPVALMHVHPEAARDAGYRPFLESVGGWETTEPGVHKLYPESAILKLQGEVAEARASELERACDAFSGGLGRLSWYDGEIRRSPEAMLAFLVDRARDNRTRLEAAEAKVARMRMQPETIMVHGVERELAEFLEEPSL